MTTIRAGLGCKGLVERGRYCRLCRVGWISSWNSMNKPAESIRLLDPRRFKKKYTKKKINTQKSSRLAKKIKRKRLKRESETVENDTQQPKI
jgi:hypothetical protein